VRVTNKDAVRHHFSVNVQFIDADQMEVTSAFEALTIGPSQTALVTGRTMATHAEAAAVADMLVTAKITRWRTPPHGASHTHENRPSLRLPDEGGMRIERPTRSLSGLPLAARRSELGACGLPLAAGTRFAPAGASGRMGVVWECGVMVR